MRDRPYAAVPYDWTRNDGAHLSSSAFKLYHMLLAFRNYKTGLCNPSQRTLGKLLKVRPRRIRALLHELEQSNLVQVFRQRNGAATVLSVKAPMDVEHKPRS